MQGQRDAGTHLHHSARKTELGSTCLLLLPDQHLPSSPALPPPHFPVPHLRMLQLWYVTLCACVLGTACLLCPEMVQRQQGIRQFIEQREPAMCPTPPKGSQARPRQRAWRNLGTE